MKSFKDVHKDVLDVLHKWNYKPMDIVHSTDLGYAIYHSIDNMSHLYQYHAICMCLSKIIVDMGDGLYMIEEETKERLLNISTRSYRID